MFNRPPETYAPSDDAVLDFGAGNGLLARVIRKLNASVVIDDVEPNEAGSGIASGHYRSFHEGYADEFLRLHPEHRYDYIVLNDVIGHPVDPVELLQNLREAAGTKCRLLVSMPYVAYVGCDCTCWRDSSTMSTPVASSGPICGSLPCVPRWMCSSMRGSMRHRWC